MSDTNGWTMSPTATSDLQGPHWGANGSAHCHYSFHRTFRPFEETIVPLQQTRPRELETQQFPSHSFGPSRLVPNHRSRSSRGIQQHRRKKPSQPIPNNDTSNPQAPILQRYSSDGARSESSPGLSPRRRREIISRVNESVQSVMSSMLSDKFSNLQWKLKLQKKDVSCYLDETSVKPGQLRFCCVSHTHAPVDEVMSLFLSTDQESMLRNNRLLYDNLLETRLLSVLRGPTTERPMRSVYVRHSSFQTRCSLANRQVCVAVATDMIHQPDGSTIGYCLWDSIDDPEFAMRPGLEVCSMFRSGFFIRRPGRTKSGVEDPKQGQTKIVYMVGMEPGTWMSGLTARFVMESHGSSLGRLCSHLRRKHLDLNTFVMKTQWISKSSAKNCEQCDKSFQVLSNRVNCHACGQVVCKSCSSKESIELHAVGLVPMNICFSCLEKAGLPSPASTHKNRPILRRRRLYSDTANICRTRTQRSSLSRAQMPPLQSI